MSDILFEVLKVVVMLAALLVTRYLIPWIKGKIGADKLSEIASWAKQAVLMAQQVYKDWSGPDKKAYVTEFLKEILELKNLDLSDEQINVLIEAAVKQMKIEENAGVVIEAAEAQEEKEG
jgi:LL-H family phage holin